MGRRERRPNVSRRHTARTPGHTSSEPQRRLGNQTTPSMADVCPEVRVIAEEAGITRPRAILHLQRQYERSMQNAQSDWDSGGPVLTYISRSGHVSRSVPADPMAERLVGSLV